MYLCREGLQVAAHSVAAHTQTCYGLYNNPLTLVVGQSPDLEARIAPL